MGQLARYPVEPFYYEAMRRRPRLISLSNDIHVRLRPAFLVSRSQPFCGILVERPSFIANEKIMKFVRTLTAIFVLVLGSTLAFPTVAEDGYELWLRYPQANATSRERYREAISSIVTSKASPTLQAAHDELAAGLKGILGVDIPSGDSPEGSGVLLLGTPSSPFIAELALPLQDLGEEGYLIKSITKNGNHRCNH